MLPYDEIYVGIVKHQSMTRTGRVSCLIKSISVGLDSTRHEGHDESGMSGKQKWYISLV